MGPLVPDIISPEFNYIIALIVGIGFGYALEQAGFASTKKLVGLFYGYDFTVLRVFFTAGITAMVGVLLLSHFELLDIRVIYINPTFLWSALVGGGIMGIGFIVGGFCPGTSACAAATGKVDGMVFLIGSVLGILVFTEGYPVWEGLHNAEAWGPVLMYEQLGMTKEVFGILMIIVAVGAFFMTQLIENKINKKETKMYKPTIVKNVIITVVPILAILFIAITPNKTEIMNSRIDKRIAAGQCEPRFMDADKLVYELVNQYYNYNVIDVRTKEEFKLFHIPTAINIPLQEMHEPDNLKILIQNYKTNVFYGVDMMQSQRACLVSKYFGKSDNYALNINAEQFRKQYFMLKKPGEDSSKEEMQLYTFRKDAARKLSEIEEVITNMSKPVEKKVKRVQGGCS